MPAPNQHRQAGSIGSCWFDTPLAQRLLVQEQREVIPLLTTHIGVRGLYIRPSVSAPADLSGNMLQSVVNLHCDGTTFAGDVRADMPALPIENDALCLVYALHALDIANEPEALLENVRRVLRPEGVLFLLGLSPTSAWRLRWMGHGVLPHSAGSMRQMLSRVGLSVELQAGVGSLLPGLAGPQALRSGDAARSLLDPLRAGYLLVARKRRLGVTPIGRTQRAMGALQPQARMATR